jgi:hypothetical protein
MQGSCDYALVFSDSEVSSWDCQAKQPAVRSALEVVHRAGKKLLLAGDAAEPPLEALLDGRDEATLDRLLVASTRRSRPLNSLRSPPCSSRPTSTLPYACGNVEVVLEGRHDKDLLALLAAVARFLEAHGVSPREVLECYGRDTIGQRAG